MWLGRKRDAASKRLSPSRIDATQAGRIIAMHLIVLALLTVSGSEYPPTTAVEAAIQSKADCVSSAQRGSTGFKDGEYLPAYSTRPVPHLDSTGRKSVGYHCWTLKDSASSSHGLRWFSDAVNAMNDLVIYRYDVGGGAAKQIFLELKNGTITFTNRDGRGNGDALILAVYEGLAPATLFRGKAIDFAKPNPLYGPKRWVKAEKKNNVTIDTLTVPLKIRAGIKDVSVILAGIDSWTDTSVSIDINGVSLLSKAPLRKK